MIKVIYTDEEIEARALNIFRENISRKGLSYTDAVTVAVIEEYGIEAFTTFMNEAQDFLDFKISIGTQLYDVKTPKGKSLLARDIICLIANIPDEIERSEYLKKLSKKIDVVLTGRYAPKNLIAFSDFANKISIIKLPKKIIAKKGIQY